MTNTVICFQTLYRVRAWRLGMGKVFSDQESKRFGGQISQAAIFSFSRSMDSISSRAIVSDLPALHADDDCLFLEVFCMHWCDCWCGTRWLLCVSSLGSAGLLRFKRISVVLYLDSLFQKLPWHPCYRHSDEHRPNQRCSYVLTWFG